MRQCPNCNSENIIGCEYPYDDPMHYDGISEWRCGDCDTRVGRWTGKILEEGEGERPFGGGVRFQ